VIRLFSEAKREIMIPVTLMTGVTTYSETYSGFAA